LVERVELSTLLHCRTTLNLHRNFGTLHVICFCSHSFLLRNFVKDCDREGFSDSLRQPKEWRKIVYLKWWQLAYTKWVDCLLLEMCSHLACVMDALINEDL
jgi:hypothetical protein